MRNTLAVDSTGLNAEKGKILLPLARAAIAREFLLDDTVNKSAAWLREPGACFVTLTQHGELRGCIGSLEAHRALLHDVEANARAAAFTDPRFSPLAIEDFEKTHVEVSLLSPLEPMQFTDEADALARLRSGIDGVVLAYGHLRCTFLPQVWKQLPAPREFLAQLKVKARLPANFWAKDIKLYRYTVAQFKEAAV